MPLSLRTQYPEEMWRFVYIMLFEFHYNYKIPTSGEYILTRDAQILTYAWEGGVRLKLFPDK